MRVPAMLGHAAEWQGRSRCRKPLGWISCALTLVSALAYFVTRSFRRRHGKSGGPYEERLLASPNQEGMLFGLSGSGMVFVQARHGDTTAFVEVRGAPCGGVWGKPIDVDASSRAIWVVCSRSYKVAGGMRTEHFLFAKWGWTLENNHHWWHMMRGGDVVQLDADDDAMWGVDGAGSILWRPAGNVGKYSRWLRVDGPSHTTPIKLVAADNNDDGTWLWCIDHSNHIWLHVPSGNKSQTPVWVDVDSDGQLLWPSTDSNIVVDLRADSGLVWAVNSNGELYWRKLNGECCSMPGMRWAVRCWCHDLGSPRLLAVSDSGNHGLGLSFPTLHHRHESAWSASANRVIHSITNLDDGHNAQSPAEESQYFANGCAHSVDHCSALWDSVPDMRRKWHQATKSEWTFWDWSQLKHEYGTCTSNSIVCQQKLKHYGAFRDLFMQHLFCCSRSQLSADDENCSSAACKAYDMTCPGSRLLTSDLDCTVYHSRDPGALMLKMSSLTYRTLMPWAQSGADLGTLFDVSLYGTWTWIPDAIFQRFDWPARSKALFERVPSDDTSDVWVFRRKCTLSARQAIAEKVKTILKHGADQENELSDEEKEKEAAAAVKRFVGSLAEGTYGDGNKVSDWDRIFQDFRAISSKQREGYLTYAATLEIVGRQQSGLPATFGEDFLCMRQVSFLEQLAFIAEHLQREVPETITESSFQTDILDMILHSGKYFDRLLEVGGAGYDEGHGQWRADLFGARDNSVLSHVLARVHFEHYSFVSEKLLIPQGPTIMDEAAVRIRSCMDIAMWGNAARHLDALRRDEGDLTRPMVEALFACFVPPNSSTEGLISVKESMRRSLEAWVDAVPPLDEPTSAQWLRARLGLAFAMLVVGLVWSRRRTWKQQ